MINNNIDLENAVLGALILESNSFEDLNPSLKIKHFETKENQLIFKTIKDFYLSGKKIDQLTIINETKKHGILPFYITGLVSKVGSASHVQYHSTIIIQNFIKRELMTLCNHVMQNIEFEDVDNLIEKIQKDTSNLYEEVEEEEANTDIVEVINENRKELIKRNEAYKQGGVYGVNTGLSTVNKLTGGWQKQNLIVVAARPSMGKTALSLFFARKAAQYGSKTAIFNLEMSKIDLIDRLRLSYIHENYSDFDEDLYMDGVYNFEFIEKIDGELDRLPIRMYEKPRAIQQVIRILRKLKRDGNLDFAVIDYLQLFNYDTKQFDNSNHAIGYMSKVFKNLATELNIPIMLLSQLNRENEKGGAVRRPTMSNLRESGEIEQNADLVVLIHRPDYYNKANPDDFNFITEIIFDKHRARRTDIVSVVNNPTIKTYRDLSGNDLTEINNNGFEF